MGTDFILVQWPESQTLMGLEDFEEHSSLANCEIFGPCAYFVEKEWLDETD